MRGQTSRATSCHRKMSEVRKNHPLCQCPTESKNKLSSHDGDGEIIGGIPAKRPRQAQQDEEEED